MPKTIVALDLETTGLEADRDAIIEIGAVRFKGERVEAEFSTLVNPGRKLSPFITRLTGITDALFEKAQQLPLELLAEIVRAGQEISWGGDLIMNEALRARAQERGAARQVAGGAYGPLFGGGASG